jgi:hypothetical protein
VVLARGQDAGLSSVFTSVSRLSAPSSRQRSNARLRFHFLDLRSARPLAFFFFVLDFVGRFSWRRFCRPARAQIRPAAIPWPAPVVRPWPVSWFASRRARPPRTPIFFAASCAHWSRSLCLDPAAWPGERRPSVLVLAAVSLPESVFCCSCLPP